MGLSVTESGTFACVGTEASISEGGGVAAVLLPQSGGRRHCGTSFPATDGRVVSIKLIYIGYNAEASWREPINRDTMRRLFGAQTNRWRCSVTTSRIGGGSSAPTRRPCAGYNPLLCTIAHERITVHCMQRLITAHYNTHMRFLSQTVLHRTGAFLSHIPKPHFCLYSRDLKLLCTSTSTQRSTSR